MTAIQFCSYLAQFMEREMFQAKVVEKVKNTHFMLNSLCTTTTITPPTHTHTHTHTLKNCAIYEMRWKNIIELGRLQVIIQRMHFACWVTKDTNTHL